MVKTRLVACLLWRDGNIVQSVQFQHTNVIGSATTAVDFFNVWGIDEIVLLNVSREESTMEEFYETILRLSRKCFVPLTAGGWVSTKEDIRTLLTKGADKVAINTAAFRDPSFITDAAGTFGSQCIVVSIDTKETEGGSYEVMIDRGGERTGQRPVEWASEAESRGAGEIFLTSIDRDGTKKGYDVDLVGSVVEAVDIPVVASGGAGEWEHLADCIRSTGVDAVSVANRFHHSQHSTKKAKEFLIEEGFDVREPMFASRFRVD